MGLCLVAAFAISAMAAASALAINEPEYFTAKNTCTKTFGHLAYAGECLTGTGKPIPAQTVSYTENGGPANLEGALKIECASNSGKGKLSGGKGAGEPKANRTTKLKITYKGCKETGTSKECTKTFSTPETIVTEGIKGNLVRASAESGKPTIVANKLEPEKPTKGFANFKCGTSTNFITVKVQGDIIIEIEPVIEKPEQGALSSVGFTFNKEKEAIAGCGKQQLLYVNGTGACHFLKVVENGNPLEPSWNVAENEVKYGLKKVETVEKGTF